MNKNPDNRIINLVIFNNIIWGVDEGINASTCVCAAYYSLCIKLELSSASSMFTKLFSADDRNKTNPKITTTTAKTREKISCSEIAIESD